MTSSAPVCPVCGARPSSLSYQCHGHDLYQCPRCAIQLLWPDPYAGRHEDLYGEDYYVDRWGTEELADLVGQIKRRTFDLLLNRIERLRSPGRVLDVGCAIGHFLVAATARGWDAYGIDINAAAIREAAKTFGQRVRVGTLEDLAASRRRYDLIVATDVIEHISDPKPFLHAAAGLLAPEGLLALTTPDTASFSCRLLGRFWPHYKEEHIVYYNAANLTRLVSACGLEVLRTHPTRKALSVGYALRVLGEHSSPFSGGLARLLDRVCPDVIKRRWVVIPCGTITAITRRAPRRR